jgi:hypothetical protein
MINVVVFSKDRAAQLDLFLRSAEELARPWRELEPRVVCVASSPDFALGYDAVAAAHPAARLVVEQPGAFRRTVLDLLDERLPLSVFFVDDDVFVRGCELLGDEVLRFLADPRIAAYSLRLGESIDYCYALDRSTPSPAFGPGRTWRWRDGDGDWAYPMSLDGHLFRTAEILSQLERTDFANPNTLEAALADAPLPHPFLACGALPSIVNVPANRVQDVARNRHMGRSAEDLNRRFLGGERIALAPLLGLVANAVHVELDYVLERGVAAA